MLVSSFASVCGARQLVKDDNWAVHDVVAHGFVSQKEIGQEARQTHKACLATLQKPHCGSI